MSRHYLHPSELTVACHVRTALVLEPVDAKIETLQACEAEGDVDELLVRSWPAEVELDSDSPYHEVIERFREFERWADRHDVRVRPPFAIREKTTLAADEPREVLVTPTLCLALYDDERLVGVYPHSDGESTVTATEAIASLRTGTMPPLLGTASSDREAAPDREDPSPAASSSDALEDDDATEPSTGTAESLGGRSSAPSICCPDCGEQLTNVQGILACTGCNWTDTALDAVDSPRAKLVYLALLDEPVSIEALSRAVNMKKLALYGIIQTLSNRDLVEEVAPETYRARHESDLDESIPANPEAASPSTE